MNFKKCITQLIFLPCKRLLSNLKFVIFGMFKELKDSDSLPVRELLLSNNVLTRGKRQDGGIDEVNALKLRSSCSIKNKL